jgi:hypothetical protein
MKTTTEHTARWQEIKYNAKGEPFVTFRKVRYYLDQFMRLPDGRGYICTSNFGGIVLEFSEDGEEAKVYEES